MWVTSQLFFKQVSVPVIYLKNGGRFKVMCIIYKKTKLEQLIEKRVEWRG